MDADRANARRCLGRKGTYEAWYVTVNDPSTRRGFWLRYTTFDPGPRSEIAPHAALWAFGFDHDDPAANWGAKETFPLKALRVDSTPFKVRLANSELAAGGCRGELTAERGVARWDLKWVSRAAPFPFLAERFGFLSSVSNIGVRPSLEVEGSIELGGRTHTLSGAFGGQQHTWGSSHALRWNWGFAAGPDHWVDGASSVVRSRLGRQLRGTSIGASVGAESFLFNGPVGVLRLGGEVTSTAWVAAAEYGGRRLSVTVRPRLQDLLGVQYDDPRGGVRYCYHTEVADLSLVLSRGSETLAEVKRPAAAAFEYSSEAPLLGVPIAV